VKVICPHKKDEFGIKTDIKRMNNSSILRKSFIFVSEKRLTDMVQLLKSKNRVFMHITYWVVMVLLFTFFWGTRYGNYWVCFYNELYFLPVKLVATYFGLYYLIPQLFKGNYLRVILLAIVTIIGSGILQRILGYYAFSPLLGFYNPNVPLFDTTDILHQIININAVMILPFSIKFYSYSMEKENRILILSREKSQAELQFLRSQIQPHFLFNVLNDIYAMSLMQSEKTPESILKLSDLMRYVLQESAADVVLIEKEINYIRNYIDLEKLRYSDRFTVDLQVTGDINNFYITPLLLLPFVENAFKHSSTNEKGGAWIKINLAVNNQQMSLIISNSFDPEVPKQQHVSSGIGIKNVRKRLDILYPGSYTFETEISDLSYKTVLNINLVS